MMEARTKLGRVCGALRLTALTCTLIFGSRALAQPGMGMSMPPEPVPAREAAEQHFDLTGYWVPIITEDWLYRMVTPPIGAVPGGEFGRYVQLTDAAVAAATSWDPDGDAAAGLECKAFGAGNIMRMPTRLHITWEDEETLRIDSDYGEQTRLLRFRATEADAASDRGTWQGHSVASWEKQGQRRGFGPGPSGGPGTLRVETVGMRPAYMSRNGIPYGERATMREYFVRHDDFGDAWFTVTTILEDPENLTRPHITTTHFRREADDDNWDPRPCEIVQPFTTLEPAE
jgi:hypothetical protein